MSFKHQIPSNDLPQVRAYRQQQSAMRSLRNSRDPKDQKAWREMRDTVVQYGMESLAAREAEKMLRERGLLGERVSSSSVHAQSFMSNLSVQYANEAYIGDALLPMVPVNHLTDKFAIYPKRDALAVPDDSMEGKSEASEVEQSRSSDTYTCEGRGLKESLERKTVDNQDMVFDEMMDLQSHVSDLMALAREKRSMAVLTNSSNYGSNTAAVAAADRWNSAGAGDPILKIRTARHEIWNGRGSGRIVGFCPLSVYLVLGTHPAILDVTKYTSQGIVPRQVLAGLFELDDLLIAKAWEDTANSGQTASYSRIVTSKVFGMVRVADNASLRNAAFGYTMRFKGQINTMAWFDERKGTRGTYWHQQTTDEIAKVVSADAGYLLTTVID